jgi:hypothetical protein
MLVESVVDVTSTSVPLWNRPRVRAAHPAGRNAFQPSRLRDADFTFADGSPMRAERLCLSDVFVGRFARLTVTRIEAISPGTPISRSAPLSSPVTVEARGFNPAKSAPPKTGFSPGAVSPAPHPTTPPGKSSP